VRGAAVSIGVWQDVFAVLDGAKSSNAEPITREAASILIQLAAPRDSIYHFIKLAHEQSYSQKMQVRERVDIDGFKELLDQLSPEERDRPFEGQAAEQASSDGLLQELFDESYSSQSEQDVAELQSERDRDFEKLLKHYFYVDHYSDYQLLQVLSFFEEELTSKCRPEADFLPRIFEDPRHELLGVEHSGEQFSRMTSQMHDNMEAIDDEDELSAAGVNLLQPQPLWIDRQKQPVQDNQDVYLRTEVNFPEAPIFDSLED
jgi:hypothetical protein